MQIYFLNSNDYSFYEKRQLGLVVSHECAHA